MASNGELQENKLSDPPPKAFTAAKEVSRGRRMSYDVPWNYGRFRMVVTRRVTEEEQISIECYEQTRETAIDTFELFLRKCREHMIEHNERVVLAHRGHINQLERIIEQKEQEIQDLGQDIAKLKVQRENLALPTGEGDALD